jgi:hypothetical protein
MGKYFTVEVKPTITASKQASMADGDVLFDWTAFDVPKGAVKLTNLTALIRGNDGAPQTARDINFYFAKSADGGNTAPSSLGTLSATADGTGYYNQLLTKVHIEASGDYGTGLDFMSIATTGHGAANNQGNLNIVLQGEEGSGTNVGYDKLYVGATAGGSLDFSTGSLLNMGSGQAVATTATTLTTDGTDARQVFAVGDVIHAADDAVAGTVTAVGSATAVTVDAVAGALANNDELYVLSPITLKLSFEK